jgi:hypothetical protein
MRGQEKNVKSITLTGNVYLNHHDYEQINAAQTGDIYLYLNNEEELFLVIENEYQIKGFKGYFKAKVFDGRTWCFLDSLDFFEDRIHQFTKSEVCIYTYHNCQERLIARAGDKVYRTYREHYTTQLHQSDDFKGKKGHKHKKN